MIDIPIQWIEAWKSIQIYPEFELPNVSNFLTTDFSIMQIPEDIPVMPVQVHCDAILGIWHKFDNIFKLPKAHMYFYFITPLVQYSAKQYVWDILNEINYFVIIIIIILYY